MTGRRLVAALALATTLSACGGPGWDGGEEELKPGRGRLVLQLETRDGGPLPDGTYVRVEGPKRVILVQRIDTADIARTLKAGKYQVVAWQQSCDDCSANLRCGANVEVPDQGKLRVVILLDPGTGCTITTP